MFHPELPRIGMRLAPQQHERASQSVPIMYGVFLGPLLIALGAFLRRAGLRRAGLFFALGATGAMADIGSRRVVPGANDNLSSVAVLVALAHALRDQPLLGVRVILLSTGSEESFMEGMQGFARRHFQDLPRSSTEFVCLECVGSPELCVVEGEGMLRMRDYPEEARDALERAGARAGVTLRRGLRTVAASDALIPLRAGYRVSLLGGDRRDQVPGQLPLAHRHPRQPHLGVGRGRGGHLRVVRARGLSAEHAPQLRRQSVAPPSRSRQVTRSTWMPAAASARSRRRSA